MSAYDLTLYLHLAFTLTASALAIYLFGEAFLNWRAQVRRGSNGARHRVAENAVVTASGLVAAILYMALRSLIALFVTSDDYRETGLVLFRLYAIGTAIYLLIAMLRSVQLIREVTIILDNVATDEGLDLPSLDPRPKASINSEPIKRDPEHEAAMTATAPLPIVTAPVAVVVSPTDPAAAQVDQTIPVVVAPVIVVAPPPDSVAGRAAQGEKK